MFALIVRYLTGRAVATDPGWREAPEWPPHPARLFFALVDALHANDNQPVEREALGWLTRQSPPELQHSEKRDRVQNIFVPVNDTNDQYKNEKFYPEIQALSGLRRLRQERSLPSVTPDDPLVHFIWRDADPSPPIRAALAAIASRVARLGHSTSLVSIRVCDNPPAARLIPDPAGDLPLRVFDESTLEAVENAFEVSIEIRQRGILPVRFLNYRDTKGTAETPIVPRGVFTEMFVFSATGPRLPIVAAPAVARAMRAAAIAKAPSPIPELLSGHHTDGSPSAQPHLAFAALPYVGDPQDRASAYADGHLLGVAVIQPKDVNGDERLSVLRAIGNIEELHLGRMGVWKLTRTPPDPPLYGLKRSTWTQASKRWASATPIVLDRFPSDPFGREAAEIIASSCERIGLPRPCASVSRFSTLIGVPPSNAFTPIARPGMPPRFHVHAELVFPTAVSGPILIGAGRYRGFGLCRPVRRSGSRL